jgi:type II secretory ATPase GspE/PulE/Tfp pilus assembly ATPase PilB-like protein
MQDILETGSILTAKKVRVHVAPEGVAVTRRRGFAPWEQATLIPFDQIRSVAMERRGRRWSVFIEGPEDKVEVPRLAKSEAQWVSSLIQEELGVRARRVDPRFAQRVWGDRFTEVFADLLRDDERQVASVVDFLLLQAVYHEASDVHFEPFHTTLRVRFRVDGMLYDVAEIPTALQPRVLARLKVLAKLAIFRHDVPQEGRTIVESDGRSIDLRVSVLPTIHGEKAVVRLFDSARAVFPLEALGMSEETHRRYLDLIRRPQGTILLTGPANSGKTTTLYSSLKYLHEERRNLTNIVTVEDPVEYDLQVVSQTQVNPVVGLTFAQGLRTVLRQDPEVIMVGEIRDPETAQIAIRAGLTGHLIFSTVHARSAAGVFARLLELGTEPFLVASSVSGVMEQRLLRRICPACAVSYQPAAEDLRRAGLSGGSFKRGPGCEECQHTGYRGRIGVFALLTVDEPMRELVMARAPLAALEAAARRVSPGLFAAGLDKVRDGVTTVEELLRVIEPPA